MVSGADNRKNIDKFRGNTLDLIILDECASFEAFIKELFFEVLEPTLMIRNGTFCLTGTPKGHCAGLFYNVTNKIIDPKTKEDYSNWTIHKWLTMNNPEYAKDTNYLENIKRDHGWTELTPEYRREYLGIWIPSDKELVYQFDSTINTFDGQLPQGDWIYIAGIDWGFRDKTAIVVAAYCRTDPNLYIVYQGGWSFLDITDTMEKIQKVKMKFPKISRWVLEVATGGKTWSAELQRRYGFHITETPKADKMDFIGFMNDDLRRGRIKVVPKSPIIEEWNSLVLEEDGHEKQGISNDFADAALYAYRFCRQYMFRPAQPKKTDEQKELDLLSIIQEMGKSKKQAAITNYADLFPDMDPTYRN